MDTHGRESVHFHLVFDKGFVRYHRMQWKHCSGISNPQCVHRMRLFHLQISRVFDEEKQERWMELTSRHLNFPVPREAGEFSSWMNLPNTEFELERPDPTSKSGAEIRLSNLFHLCENHRGNFRVLKDLTRKN